MDEPSITCPQCGMTSYNANDIKFGYCGNCHAYTGEDRTQALALVSHVCSSCHLVAPFHEKECPVLRAVQAEMAEEFGDRHPSLRPVRGVVDQISVQPRDGDQPQPGSADWNDWCRLFEAVTTAPGIKGELLFSKRRRIALHLWRLGYR